MAEVAQGRRRGKGLSGRAAGEGKERGEDGRRNCSGKVGRGRGR